jgi:DNA-binding response OmpR family regulator
MKILVVEDHADTLDYLSQYLKMQGHDIHAAHNVNEAINSLEHFPLDVIISDIRLPDGNGWSLMKQARVSQKNLVGIAMSGISVFSERKKSFSAGYKHYLVKPFFPEDLDILLEEVDANSR